MRVMRDGTRYVAVSTYDERELPKAAGFRWDRELRRWWTSDPAVAGKLAQYADADLRPVLEAAAQARADVIAASRATAAAVDVPKPDGETYMPFQLAGIAYMAGRPAALNGDAPGLGKTIQAVGVINADPSIFRVLVICPATLRANWACELRKWLVVPAARLGHLAPKSPRETSTDPLTIGLVSTAAWPETDIVIVNYDIAEKLRDRLRAETWDLVVIDEAHYCKNPKAQRTAAVVGREERRGKQDGDEGIRARRKLALTGTPIVNRPAEAWPVLHWLDPVAWPRFWPYAMRYCGAHQNRYGWDVSGATHLDELQEKLRSTVMIRRLKEDVLTELPAKRRQVLVIPANGAQRVVDAEARAWHAREAELEELRAQVELAKAWDDDEAYEAAVQRLTEATRAAFTEMSRLRHETALAKVPYVIEHVQTLLDAGQKVVVFAHHHDVIAAIRDGLADAQPVELTGETAMRDRQGIVDRFQTDPACRVFIGSITAAGVGLTLTASSHVVFAELDWVPGNVTQAEDRTHRIGQREAVLVQHVVLDGSLDARMAHVLVEKQDVLDRALDREPDPLPVLPEAAATEAAPRSRVAKMAAALTDAHRATVHTALRVIAGMCDGARVLDGCGFNKLDTRVGKELAAWPSLTVKQAALGLLIARKYRRQLGETLAADLAAVAAATKEVV
jgi:SWI/SNF-related matrix-associated actin-dependent regulator 1 of chromatin subfamily A